MPRPASASRASTRSRAASSRPCTAAASGRCASTPASAPPKSRTAATATCSSQGQTGLSVAFDLPTQIGYDSDDPMATGEVGKVGVAIDSHRGHADALRPDPARQGHDLDDHQRDGAGAARALRRGRQGAGRSPAKLGGTVQNDILKEYITRGTYIYPPKPSMRLITDVFRYCKETCPAGTRSRSRGYHMREAGSTAAQEIAFTLADGIEYVQRRDRRRARRRRLRAASSASSSPATATSSKRWRSSAPRGGCGRSIMKERFERQEPALA